MIKKEALEKAYKLSGNGQPPGGILRPEDVLDAFARYIEDVSETATGLDSFIKSAGYSSTCPARIDLSELILPDPEDDLLKEAREICALMADSLGCASVARAYRDGQSDTAEPMRCTLAALKRKEG